VWPRATMCPAASDPASLLRWAPALPRVPQLRTPPPCRGELRCCHVPISFGPHFPVTEGSDGATCLMALESTSPKVELRCHHMSHNSQRAMGHENKERLGYLSMQLCLPVPMARSCVTEAPVRRADRQRHHILQDMRVGRYSAAQ
jgi:hypothetical protein